MQQGMIHRGKAYAAVVVLSIHSVLNAGIGVKGKGRMGLARTLTLKREEGGGTNC